MGGKRGSGRGAKNVGATRRSNNFEDLEINDQLFTSQGLREVNNKVDALLGFPMYESRKSNNYSKFLSNDEYADSYNESKLVRILSTVEALNNKFNILTSEVKFLKEQLGEALSDIKDLKNKNLKLEKELNEFKTGQSTTVTTTTNNIEINRMQTHLRQKCLLLSGSALTLPDDADNLNSRSLAHVAFNAIKTEIGSDAKITDIEDCKKFGKPTDDLKLLVTFTSTFVKEELLSKYVTGMINKRSTHSDSNEDIETKLYMNEYLSHDQSNIFFKTRQLKKELKDKIYTVFTRRGITVCKTSKTANPIYVRCMNDFNKLQADLNRRNLRSGRR